MSPLIMHRWRGILLEASFVVYADDIFAVLWSRTTTGWTVAWLRDESQGPNARCFSRLTLWKSDDVLMELESRPASEERGRDKKGAISCFRPPQKDNGRWEGWVKCLCYDGNLDLANIKCCKTVSTCVFKTYHFPETVDCVLKTGISNIDLNNCNNSNCILLFC